MANKKSKIVWIDCFIAFFNQWSKINHFLWRSMIHFSTFPSLFLEVNNDVCKPSTWLQNQFSIPLKKDDFFKFKLTFLVYQQIIKNVQLRRLNTSLNVPATLNIFNCLDCMKYYYFPPICVILSCNTISWGILSLIITCIILHLSICLLSTKSSHEKTESGLHPEKQDSTLSRNNKDPAQNKWNPVL